jgi:hypothetical protein
VHRKTGIYSLRTSLKTKERPQVFYLKASRTSLKFLVADNDLKI